MEFHWLKYCTACKILLFFFVSKEYDRFLAHKDHKGKGVGRTTMIDKCIIGKQEYRGIICYRIYYTKSCSSRIFFFGLLAQFMSESKKPQFLYMNWHNTQQIFCFFNFNVFIFVPAVHICVPLLLLLSNSRHVSLPANIRFILFGLCVSRPRPLVSFA